MVLAMYLNIVEYIDDEQEELMEMIGLSEKIEGIIAQIRNEARNDGEKEGMKKGGNNVINRLIDNFSSGDGSDMVVVSKSTLLSMLQK